MFGGVVGRSVRKICPMYKVWLMIDQHGAFPYGCRHLRLFEERASRAIVAASYVACSIAAASATSTGNVFTDVPSVDGRSARAAAAATTAAATTAAVTACKRDVTARLPALPGVDWPHAGPAPPLG